MIEFKGYISGAAEKYFFALSRKIVIKIFLVSEVLVLLPIAFLGIKHGYWPALIFCAVGFVGIPLLTYIPMTKKNKLGILPQRIYTDSESITCIAEKYVESKLIGDEIALRDHGEFYELVYPFGKASEKFICQKSLLTQGTLEEFEALFEGKIERI